MKKFRTVFVVLTLVCSLFMNSFAYMPSDVQSYDEGVTAIEFAQGFIDGIEPNKDFVAGESINIYDQNDMLIGFCIDLFKDEEPSGYVVIKLTEAGPVVEEFATEAGVSNLYDCIADSDTTSEEFADKKLYGFGPMEYVVPKEADGETVYIDNTGEKFTEEEYDFIVEEWEQEQALSVEENGSETISSYTYEEVNFQEDEGINDPETATSIVDGYSVICSYETFLANKGTTTSYNSLPGYLRNTVYGQSDFTNATGRYACSVVALTNMVSYFQNNGYSRALINKKIRDTFNSLWTLTETSVTHTNNGISYGGTVISKQAGAIETYFSQRGYNVTVDEYTSVSFSNYMRDINANKPCIFDYGAIFNGKAGGHSVFVVGYSQTTGPDYLLVEDGWSNYYRYLNFDSNFSFKYGRSVKMNSSPGYK